MCRRVRRKDVGWTSLGVESIYPSKIEAPFCKASGDCASSEPAVNPSFSPRSASQGMCHKCSKESDTSLQPQNLDHLLRPENESSRSEALWTKSSGFLGLGPAKHRHRHPRASLGYRPTRIAQLVSPKNTLLVLRVM